MEGDKATKEATKTNALNIIEGINSSTLITIHNRFVEKGFVFIARPTNMMATYRIKYNGAVGKPITAKGKSSSIDGYIPCDARLSKLYKEFYDAKDKESIVKKIRRI